MIRKFFAPLITVVLFSGAASADMGLRQVACFAADGHSIIWGGMYWLISHQDFDGDKARRVISIQNGKCVLDGEVLLSAEKCPGGLAERVFIGNQPCSP